MKSKKEELESQKNVAYESTIESTKINKLEWEFAELSQKFDIKQERYNTKCKYLEDKINDLEKEIIELDRLDRLEKEQEENKKKTKLKPKEIVSGILPKETILKKNIQPEPITLEPEIIPEAMSEILEEEIETEKPIVMTREPVVEKESTNIEDINSEKQKAHLINAVTEGQPEHVIADKVIENSVSKEDFIKVCQEIQTEFPDGNVNEIIQNEVTRELNEDEESEGKKSRFPRLEKFKKKHPKFCKIVRESTKIFLFLVTVSTITSLKPAQDKEVVKFSNLKIDKLKDVDWEKIDLGEEELNKLGNICVITKAPENINKRYMIVDKETGTIHVYQGDKLMSSFPVSVGARKGDEQTILKSLYTKIGDPTKTPVNFNEATYKENDASFVKEGYEVDTKWGTGNLETGAGIYSIASIGEFLGHDAFFLMNENGQVVATSIHVSPHVREQGLWMLSNGCIGGDEKTIDALLELMKQGMKVYVLPQNEHNKYKLVDGEIRFISNQENVNKTTINKRPFKAKEIILKAEDLNDQGREVLFSLSKNKEKLMKLYPTVSNDVYNHLAKITYGLFGRETSFGTYGGGRGQWGRVGDMGKTMLYDKPTKEELKRGKTPSVGVTQVNFSWVDKKVKDAFDIRDVADLYDIEKGTAGAMSLLLDMYVNSIPYDLKDNYEELVILGYRYSNSFNKAIVVKTKDEVETLYKEGKLTPDKYMTGRKLAQAQDDYSKGKLTTAQYIKELIKAGKIKDKGQIAYINKVLENSEKVDVYISNKTIWQMMDEGVKKAVDVQKGLTSNK